MHGIWTRAIGTYGPLVALSTFVGLIANWRLSVLLIGVVGLVAWVDAYLSKTPRWWLFWLRLRVGPSTGLRALAARAARAVKPPSLDEQYAWNSRTAAGLPLVVPARLADMREAWPHWAFNIRILRNGLEITAEATGPVVGVRLTAHDFAIYNNEGKRWLRNHPRTGEDYTEAANLDAEFTAAIRQAERRRDGWTTTIAVGFPLRWASGGCLPIVDIDSTKWVAVLFRDIYPIGWNVANGGSESLHEQVDVTEVLRREFREELIVLTADPLKQSGHHPKAVSVRSLVWAGESRRARHETHGLALRRKHDGMTFTDDAQSRSQDAIEVTPIPTPWRLSVVAADGTTEWLDNTFPSMDAREHGLEAVQVVAFRLGVEDVLLDGEVTEKIEALVRRPVVLLRLDALRSLYRQTGGLGGHLRTGSKVLPPLAAQAIITFDLEPRLIRARLEALRRADPESDPNAATELRHLEPSLRRHEALLAGHLDEHLQLDRLGTVTWNTLEAMFREEARLGVDSTGATH